MSDNGASPAEDLGLAAHMETASARRRKVLDELRELHDAEQVIVEGLTRQVTEAKTRRDGYKRALDGLGGVRPAARAAAKGSGRLYRPGDEYLNELLETLRDSTTALSQTQLKDRVSFSSETLSRALKTLRSEDKIRVASRSGTSNLYAAMPDA